MFMPLGAVLARQWEVFTPAAYTDLVASDVWFPVLVEEKCPHQKLSSPKHFWLSSKIINFVFKIVKFASLGILRCGHWHLFLPDECPCRPHRDGFHGPRRYEQTPYYHPQQVPPLGRSLYHRFGWRLASHRCRDLLAIFRRKQVDQNLLKFFQFFALSAPKFYSKTTNFVWLGPSRLPS